MHRRSPCGLLLLALLHLLLLRVEGWPWPEKKSAVAIAENAVQQAAENVGVAVFELEGRGTPTLEEGLAKTSLMKQAQAQSLTSPEGSCWRRSYSRLESSCSEILNEDEKKRRLAYDLTDCFLRMTGWSPLPPCPAAGPVRLCTEKLNEHILKIFLTFYLEVSGLCHYLQSDMFRKEAVQVVNDLKQTGHQMLDKVKEVKGISQDIMDTALQQSEKLKEELTRVEALSESLLEQEQQFEVKLKSTLSKVEAVHDMSESMKSKQEELQQLGHDMHQAIVNDMGDLQKAALYTNQQLQDTSEGHKHLAELQVQLADSLADDVRRLKDSALQSFNELKDSQSFAMEDTRASFKDLTEGAQKVQASLHELRTEMVDINDRLLKSSHTILKAQETFVSKQGSMLATLDHLFSLYDSILLESRALKMLVFYGALIVFVYVLTSVEQASSARAQLYIGLCVSMASELYFVKAYGSVPQNQQWIQMRSYWIRTLFGVFSVTFVFHRIVTYKDLTSQNHKLLIQMNQMLSDLTSQCQKAPYHLFDGPSTAKLHEDEEPSGRFSLRFAASPKSTGQTIVSKILNRVLKFVREWATLLHASCLYC